MKRDIYEEATLLGDLIKMELEKDGRENVIPALDVVPSAIHLKMIVDEVTEIAKGETLDGISTGKPLPHDWRKVENAMVLAEAMIADPWKKRTCLWLKGLPDLVSTNIVEPLGLWVGSTSKRRGSTSRVKPHYILHSKRDSKTRSKSFPGIARAMAEQWGGLING